ncbi:MAG: ribosomal protein S18-alanine N-acetyltransferase [Sulfurimonadaceae bacterium]|jgi:ribosomal-protein-alanine N-acetyltransferase|nr:ribosomal protein S18-alanine N-acetyltransferase [Sulfurimonadaceae bacterium]
MILRPATHQDAKELSLLEKELFGFENYPLSYASFVYHIKNNLLIVAVEEGEIAGYILVLIKRNTPKIYSLGIKQAHRNKGIGSLLLKEILYKTKEKEFKSLILEVRVDNKSAIELYKKYNFEVFETRKSFYKDGCDALIMSLVFDK